MKNQYPSYLIFILSALIISCTERIDIKLNDSYIRLVVDGAITTDTMAHSVMLYKTTSYYFNQPAPAVTGAIVSITNGNISYELKEERSGVYRTDSSVYGLAGQTYTLNIKLSEQIGGHIEYSASSTLCPVNPLDSIGLLFHDDWSTGGIWEVKVYAQDPPTTDFYRFIISKNEIMLTDTLSEWLVTDDRFFNGNYTNGAPIAYLEQDSSDEGLYPGDKITVEMNSIGKEYAKFLWDAHSELRGSNPLFSGPAANVNGNINNGAVGFFAAYSTSMAHTYVAKTLSVL